MKIFKDGKWITPIIDNNINSSLKVFFNGKWNSIIIKDDYLANAPSNVQYIDVHKVFIYVRGAWYQIAIEEDVVNYSIDEQVLTFKNSDMDKYTSNLVIRPENGLLTAMRVTRNTTEYKINSNTNHSITSGLVADDKLVKLVGATAIQVSVAYNRKTEGDFSCNTYPTYEYTHVECATGGTSTEVVTTSLQNKNSFKTISKKSPIFMSQHIEGEGVLITQEDIDFNNKTINSFTTNHLMYAIPAFVELTQSVSDTVTKSFNKLEQFEHGNVKVVDIGIILNND